MTTNEAILGALAIINFAIAWRCWRQSEYWRKYLCQYAAEKEK